MHAHVALERAMETLEAYITARGLRRTEERYEILRTIYTELAHFDADTLYHHLLEKGQHISRATVYNTLELLTACGLVKRYSFGEGRTLYERSLGRRQHDHLICMDCGSIQEFCAPELGPIMEGVGRFFHMKPFRHEFIIYAYCQQSECPNRKKSSTFDKNEFQS
ncbi:MAG: transcriptional repressor [Bacteroidia bacterium]|nr:transcriptional repressor [Bacteroidia bacterium]MDW8015102.1 transcriptional repressor [Bacteroidia bacterium]